MEPKSVNRVFDLGFTTKENGKGTGMGLYIVKDLCDKLDIAINIKTEIDTGTVFTLGFRNQLQNNMMENAIYEKNLLPVSNS